MKPSSATQLFTICSFFFLWLAPLQTSAMSNDVALQSRIAPPITISSNGGGSEAVVYFDPQSPPVTRVTASGAAYNTVQFVISGGLDRSLFSLHPYTGQLLLSSQEKTYSGGQQPYEVEISAIDSAGSIDRQLIHAIATKNITSEFLQTQEQCPQTVITTYGRQSNIESIDMWVLGNLTSITNLKLGDTAIPLRNATIWHGDSTADLTRVHVDLPHELETKTDPLTVVWKTNTSQDSCQYVGPIHQISNVTISTTTANDSPTETTDAGFNIAKTVATSSENSEPNQATSTVTSASSTNPQCPRTAPWIWIGLIVVQIISLIVVHRRGKQWGNKQGIVVSTVAVVSFIILAVLWYLFDECQSFVWFPVLGVIISCAAILATLVHEKDI